MPREARIRLRRPGGWCAGPSLGRFSPAAGQASVQILRPRGRKIRPKGCCPRRRQAACRHRRNLPHYRRDICRPCAHGTPDGGGRQPDIKRIRARTGCARARRVKHAGKSWDFAFGPSTEQGRELRERLHYGGALDSCPASCHTLISLQPRRFAGQGMLCRLGLGQVHARKLPNIVSRAANATALMSWMSKVLSAID